jgi:hypothetical protein
VLSPAQGFSVKKEMTAETDAVRVCADGHCPPDVTCDFDGQLKGTDDILPGLAGLPVQGSVHAGDWRCRELRVGTAHLSR